VSPSVLVLLWVLFIIDMVIGIGLGIWIERRRNRL
jgi:hypothetical protein